MVGSPTSPCGLSHHTQTQGTGSGLPLQLLLQRGLLWGIPSAKAKLLGQWFSKSAFLRIPWRPGSNADGG